MVDFNMDSAISEELKSLLSSDGYVIYLDKDEYLFEVGEYVENLYIVKAGKVIVEKPTADGRGLALRICNKGDIIGEVSLYTKNVKYILNAKAHVRSEIGVIKKTDLKKSLLRNNDLAIKLINLMSEHSLRTQTKLRDLVMYGKKGALYSTLIRLANSYGIEKNNGIVISVPFTNQDLANFCGTSRESINRLLSPLRQQNILSIESQLITIHDIDFLKKEINCEDCPLVFCSIH